MFRSSRRLLTSGLLLVALAATANALRVVDYNFTNYPGTNSGLRDPKFRTILAPLNADILVTQEIQSQAGIDSILNRILNVLEPGQWAAAPFVNGNASGADLPLDWTRPFVFVSIFSSDHVKKADSSQPSSTASEEIWKCSENDRLP